MKDWEAGVTDYVSMKLDVLVSLAQKCSALILLSAFAGSADVIWPTCPLWVSPAADCPHNRVGSAQSPDPPPLSPSLPSPCRPRGVEVAGDVPWSLGDGRVSLQEGATAEEQQLHIPEKGESEVVWEVPTYCELHLHIIFLIMRIVDGSTNCCCKFNYQSPCIYLVMYIHTNKISARTCELWTSRPAILSFVGRFPSLRG